MYLIILVFDCGVTVPVGRDAEKGLPPDLFRGLQNFSAFAKPASAFAKASADGSAGETRSDQITPKSRMLEEQGDSA